MTTDLAIGERHAQIFPSGWLHPTTEASAGWLPRTRIARCRGGAMLLCDRVGPGRAIRGSDMPNIGRYRTYHQAATYVWWPDTLHVLVPTAAR